LERFGSANIEGKTRAFQIALSEVERDLVQRTLLPLFSFCEPENPTLGIKVRTLTAKIFLAANFNELVHELHSSVKPINVGHHNRIRTVSPLHFVVQKEAIFPSLWTSQCSKSATAAGLLAYKMRMHPIVCDDICGT
jgi:hypothetical protein